MAELRQALRCLRVLVRMELLRLLRTRELWTRVVLPMLVAPIAMAGISLVFTLVSFGPRLTTPVVALGPTLPTGLTVADTFRGADWEVVYVDDPAQAVAAGEAELGMGNWRAGLGLSTRAGERVAWVDDAPLSLEHGAEERPVWHVDVWSDDQRSETRWLLKRLGRDQLEAWLVAAGRPRELARGPRRVWQVSGAPWPLPDGGSMRLADDLELRGIDLFIGLVLVMAATGAGQLLGTTPAAERSDGTLETLATTAAPRWTLVLARLLSGLLVVGAVVLLMAVPFASVMLIDLPSQSPGRLLRLVFGLLVVASCALPVGFLARSAEEASRMGAVSMVLGLGLGAALFALGPAEAVLLGLGLPVGIVLVLARLPDLVRPAREGAS